MRKYHIQDREDYHKYVTLATSNFGANERYNKLCGSMRSLVHKLSLLPAQDPFRAQKESEMLNKLYDMGVLGMSPLPYIRVG
jgi:U3 small nucleolar ribonucleoprotein protein IMP3